MILYYAVKPMTKSYQQFKLLYIFFDINFHVFNGTSHTLEPFQFMQFKFMECLVKRLMTWKNILPHQQHLPKNKPFEMDDTFQSILSSSHFPTCSSCSPTHGSCSLAHEIASPKLMCNNRRCITQIKLKLFYSAWQNHAELHKTT